MSRFMTNFVPNIHGFHFKNNFENEVFDIGIASWTTKGRCGGMAYAALDYYHYGIPIPMHIPEDFSNSSSPEVDSKLAKYIYDRLIDSFTFYNARKFHDWTWKRDHSTWIFGEGVPQLSKQKEFPKLKDLLENDGPQVIGLVGATNITEIGSKNHQVVACGYEYDEATEKITIITYDNNYPNQYVSYTSEKDQRYFLSSKKDSSGNHYRYRGFFVEEYTPKRPTYIDLIVTMEISSDPLYVKLGDCLQCRFQVKNIGEFPSHIQNLYLSVEGPRGENLDRFFGSDGNGTPIQPGEERVYSKVCNDFGTALGVYTLQLSYTSGISFTKITNIPNSKPLSIDVKYLSYSLLNPPPYVEKVSVFKGKPGLTPDGFASFNTENVEDCQMPRLKYSARWTPLSGERKLNVESNTMPITATGELYVFIQFATANFVGTATPPGKMSSKVLKLKGTNANGQPVEINVNLIEGIDRSSGVYYWGTINSATYGQTNVTLNLEITGSDAVEHNPRRPIKGDLLDSQPRSIATIDRNSPPLYPIVNYQSGPDKNHSIQLTPKVLSLAPDAYESNNSFATATPCSLPLPAKNGESWAKFNNLTLQNSTDADYFKVEYHSSSVDDQSTLNGPTTVCVSELLQLYKTVYPPRLVILSECVSDGCLAVDVFKSNNLTNGYISKLASSSITIYNPTKIFTDKKVFLAIKNPDYNSQGALQYHLKIGYLPGEIILSAHGSPNIVLNDIARKFLKELFDHIDLPRPAEYLKDRIIDKELVLGAAIETAVIPNMEIFIANYAKALSDDSILTNLATIMKEDARLVIGKELNTLGKLAMKENMFDQAEELIMKGNRIFEAKGEAILVKEGVKDLTQVYTVTKQLDKNKKLNVNIGRKIR